MIEVTNSVLSALNAGERLSTALFPQELRILKFTGQLTANGASSVELSPLLRLPRNAVVAPGSTVTVTVRAGRAEWTIAKGVGQLQQQGASVVVDFGVLRTVAGVGVLDASKLQIVRVWKWTGTAFADPPVVGSAGSSTPHSGPAVLFPSQIRTERLQIDLASSADASGALLLQLPDLPADLDLRINGGAPVWSAPGPVVAGSRGWLADAASGLAYQQVDLAAALNALLSDPTADLTPEVDLHVVLAARVPGALALDPPQGLGSQLRYLAQVALPPGAEQLQFAAEGLQSVPLPLPPWVGSVERVKLTLSAKLPPERTLPPLGPDAQPVEPGSALPLAEMALDPERAAAVALPALALPTRGLGELTAVRLPLRAQAGGAEVRVLLLGNDGGEPGAALPGAVSKPVELSPAGPAPGDTDAWSTFAFPRPLPLDPTSLPFVAILVTRGQVRWAFTGDVTAGQVRFGPPDGPWQPLPGLGQLSDLRGRVRLVGHAPSGQPVAPLELGLAGGAARQPVTPTPKGVTAEAVGPVAVTAGAPALAVVSLTAGTVTLSGVVVTATRKPETR